MPALAAGWTPTDPARRIGTDSLHFSVVLPADWRFEKTFSTIRATFNAEAVELITLTAHSYSSAFSAAKRSAAETTPLEALADDYVANLAAAYPGLGEVTVLSTDVAALGGQPAFRVHLRYRLPPALSGALFEEVALGAPTKDGLVFFSYRAPAIHYFTARLADFEATIPTISFKPPPASR